MPAMTDPDGPRYHLDELASLAGVPVRTVRFYLSKSLLPQPLGRGPGKHYGEEHLWCLRAIQYYRGLGSDLASIKQLLDGRAGRNVPSDPDQDGAIAALAPGAIWLRGGKTTPPRTAASIVAAEAPDVLQVTPRVSLWTRVEVMPGVELQVHRDLAIPGEAALQHLADECRALFGTPPTDAPARLQEHDSD